MHKFQNKFPRRFRIVIARFLRVKVRRVKILKVWAQLTLPQRRRVPRARLREVPPFKRRKGGSGETPPHLLGVNRPRQGRPLALLTNRLLWPLLESAASQEVAPDITTRDAPKARPSSEELLYVGTSVDSPTLTQTQRDIRRMSDERMANTNNDGRLQLLQISGARQLCVDILEHWHYFHKDGCPEAGPCYR